MSVVILAAMAGLDTLCPSVHDCLGRDPFFDKLQRIGSCASPYFPAIAGYYFFHSIYPDSVNY